jgi:hypothetical protein
MESLDPELLPNDVCSALDVDVSEVAASEVEEGEDCVDMVLVVLDSSAGSGAAPHPNKSIRIATRHQGELCIVAMTFPLYLYAGPHGPDCNEWLSAISASRRLSRRVPATSSSYFESRVLYDSSNIETFGFG